LNLRTTEPRNTLKSELTHGKAGWIAAGLMAVAALGLLPAGNLGSGGMLGLRIAQAQNFGQRTLQGKVLDDREAPVGGATIFLKNLKTRNVKSFTSTPDGSFRFAQVGMIDDYEVWAEQGKKKSAVKTISSFDSRKELDFDLKLK
jgi:Carboxypeptidase regulatory-like domain